MNTNRKALCTDFIMYRDKIKNAFPWQSATVWPLAAMFFIQNGSGPDIERIKEARYIMKENAGMFSSFRSYGELLFACMLSTQDDMDGLMMATMDTQDLLRSCLKNSTSTAILAFFLAQSRSSDEWQKIAERTAEIYDAFNEIHPVLTDGSDTLYCGLLAMRNQPIEDIVEETELTFQDLKKDFFFTQNQLQSLCFTLALCEGKREEKLNNLLTLYELLDEREIKAGRSLEINALAIVANLGIPLTDIADMIRDTDDYLITQKGYSTWVTAKSVRYLHDALLTSASSLSVNREISSIALLTIITLIEQQAAAASAAAA